MIHQIHLTSSGMDLSMIFICIKKLMMYLIRLTLLAVVLVEQHGRSLSILLVTPVELVAPDESETDSVHLLLHSVPTVSNTAIFVLMLNVKTDTVMVWENAMLQSDSRDSLLKLAENVHVTVV